MSVGQVLKRRPASTDLKPDTGELAGIAVAAGRSRRQRRACAPVCMGMLRMPRFYFHVLDGSAIVDETGTEHPSIDAARIEAVKLASGVLREGIADRIW
jgi:hypothetical protein